MFMLKPMKKKLVNVFTVPGITAIGLITTLIFLLTGCGYNEDYLTEARKFEYDNGYKVGFETGNKIGFEMGTKAGFDLGNATGWADGRKAGIASVIVPAQIARGSVLEKTAAFYDTQGNYTRLLVTAKVQNIGDDGVIAVLAEVLPKESVLDGKNRQRIEVYFRKGEEKLLTFRFWFGAINVQYVVWTELIPPPPPLILNPPPPPVIVIPPP